jgi:MoxR-like ATPase
MTTTVDAGVRVDVIRIDELPDNVNLAWASSARASRFIQSVVDRAAEREDDVAIALLVRARTERGARARMPLESLLERHGFDVTELESELDAEGA